MTDQLDQRRVLLAAHDLLVDPPRFVGGQHLALELLVAHEQRELGEHRARRNGVEVVALQHARCGVAEYLLHLDGGDAPGTVHADRDIAAQPLHAPIRDPALDGWLDPPLPDRGIGSPR